MNKRNTKEKYLNIGLWTVQVILALSLIFGGIVKLYKPVLELAEMWPWTADTGCLVCKTAVLDLLTGIGVILPSFFRRYTGLVVYSALGIVVLMIGAIVMHVLRGEESEIVINVIFGILALFVVWGRYK